MRHGPLILVTRDSQGLCVQQVDVDLSSLELHTLGFKQFAENQPEIGDFFAGRQP